MLQPRERFAMLRLVRADRPTTLETLQTAVFYTAQLVVCSLLLLEGYHIEGSPAALWAVVSAANVIQPAMGQTISESAVRIGANLVGAISGIIVGQICGDGIWQFCAALVVVVAICEALKLDLGLREACVSVAVVMISREGSFVGTGMQRLLAVIVGCVTALFIQLLADVVRRKVLGWKGPEAPAIHKPDAEHPPADTGAKPVG